MKMSDWNAYILVHHALAALYHQGKRIIDIVTFHNKLFHLGDKDWLLDANFYDKIYFNRDEKGNWFSKGVEKGIHLCIKTGIVKDLGEGKLYISFKPKNLKQTLAGLSKKEFQNFMDFASDLNWFGKKKEDKIENSTI